MDLLKIISILGISFQFFSFWLAAPEILGPEWLQKTEVLLKKLISQIPNYILLIVGGFIGAFFFYIQAKLYHSNFTPCRFSVHDDFPQKT